MQVQMLFFQNGSRTITGDKRVAHDHERTSSWGRNHPTAGGHFVGRNRLFGEENPALPLLARILRYTLDPDAALPFAGYVGNRKYEVGIYSPALYSLALR